MLDRCEVLLFATIKTQGKQTQVIQVAVKLSLFKLVINLNPRLTYFELVYMLRRFRTKYLILTKPIKSTGTSKASIRQGRRATEDARRLLHDRPDQPRIAHHGQVCTGRDQTEAVQVLDLRQLRSMTHESLNKNSFLY